MGTMLQDVLKKIREQDNSWEEMVPRDIADLIKRRHFFGCRDAVVPERALVN